MKNVSGGNLESKMTTARGNSQRILMITITMALTAGALFVVDESVALSIRDFAGAHYWVKRTMSAVNDVFGWWLFAAMAIVVLLDADRRRSILCLAIAGGACMLAVQAAKFIVGRARPSLSRGPWSFELFNGMVVGLDSFPSGHAATAWFMAFMFQRFLPGSIWFFGPAAAIASISRVAFSRHYMSDVVVGVLLAFLATHVLFRFRRVDSVPLCEEDNANLAASGA